MIRVRGDSFQDKLSLDNRLIIKALFGFQLYIVLFNFIDLDILCLLCLEIA